MSTINLRIQNKHDTTAAWKKIENSFIPYAGEIIIYDDYIKQVQITESTEIVNLIPGLKIGTGVDNLAALPFISGLDPEFKQTLEDHINNQNIHVSGQDRIVWDSNVTYSMDKQTETLSLLKRTER